MSPRANVRLRPSRFHPRYLVLVRLREALERAVDRHLAGRGLGRALDVGAGTAPYRSLFEPHVRRYDTADLPGTGAELEVGADGRVPAESGCADLVISNQVLEHVDDPAAHLGELRRLSAPGGTLLLSTHGHWMYHPDPGDYWRWTGPGLRRLVERAGFEVLDIEGVLGRSAAGLQLAHDGLVERVPARLRPLFAFAFQVFMGAVDRVDRSERATDACVFVVSARRPRELSPEAHGEGPE